MTKTQLKKKIDHLDDQYLELIYNILCQFPHSPDILPPVNITKPTLLKILTTLEDIEDEFPDIDSNLLPLDDIRL